MLDLAYTEEFTLLRAEAFALAKQYAVASGLCDRKSLRECIYARFGWAGADPSMLWQAVVTLEADGHIAWGT